VLVDLDKTPELQVQPVVSPVNNLTPDSLTVNIVQPEIKVEVPSSTSSQIPVQANAQNPQVASLITSEVSPQISTQTTPQIIPQVITKDVIQNAPQATSQIAPMIAPTVQKNIIKNYNPTISPNHKLKLSEIAIPKVTISQILTDKQLLHDNTEQTTKFFYSTLEDKTNINLWPLVLLMLASIAYKKSKNHLKSLSFDNILTKNLSIASN
jgi:hypothetical protein